MEGTLDCGIMNMYRKNKQHPFLFLKDYTATLGTALKMHIESSGYAMMFFMSIGEAEIFDLIIEGTRYKQTCIKVGDEYIGAVHLPHITVNNIACTHNTFVDFQSSGFIVVKFDITINTPEQTIDSTCGVCHCYGDKGIIMGKVEDFILTSYD